MSDQRIMICSLTWRLLKHFMWHNSHGNHFPDGKCIHGAKFQLCSSSHSSPSRIGPARAMHRRFMRKRGLVREFPDPLCLASVWPDRRKTLRDFQNKSDNGRHRPAEVAYPHTALGEIQAVSCCFTRIALLFTFVKFLKRSRGGIKALEACYWILEATRWVRRFCLASRRVHTIWSIRFERGMCLKWDNGSLFMCVTEAWADPAPRMGLCTNTL